ALDHRGRIEAHIVGRESVVLGMLHVVVDFRRTQQRLGRNAAPIVADAAEVGFFHDRGLETELGGADRGDVAAGTGADNDDVEGCVGHGYLLILVATTINGPSPSLRGALAT